MSRHSKKELISQLIAAYRSNTSQEGKFDALAAERIGVSLTDLRCLDLVQANDGMTAGELATASGLTTGAVTAVIDRLERAGLARRVRDDEDRRKVNVEVTDRHYQESGKIWGPLMEDWQASLASRFTAAELAVITEFLNATTAIGSRHADRVRSGDRPG
ncbi:MAG TPA: MarR family transcriptional regulator [Solirubrobacterales bacterium]|nr:MarR family transcriptional regulator [Solirubrobacterales bacterium]